MRPARGIRNRSSPGPGSFGNPPVPTLLLQFRGEPPDNRNAYALSPNVFLTFSGDALAQLYVAIVYATIAYAVDEAGAPPSSSSAKTSWWKFWYRPNVGLTAGVR